MTGIRTLLIGWQWNLPIRRKIWIKWKRFLRLPQGRLENNLKASGVAVPDDALKEIDGILGFIPFERHGKKHQNPHKKDCCRQEVRPAGNSLFLCAARSVQMSCH